MESSVKLINWRTGIKERALKHELQHEQANPNPNPYPNSNPKPYPNPMPNPNSFFIWSSIPFFDFQAIGFIYNSASVGH